MQALDFVNKMNQIVFEINDSDQQTFGKEYIEKLRNSYQFKLKLPTGNETYSDPIFNVVEFYDASTVEIGMITFNKNLSEDNAFYYLGKFENDDLVVQKKSKKILLKERAQDRILYQCAETGSKFLEAILIAAEYLAKIPIGKDVSEDPHVCVTASKCANAAGGSSYEPFYKMLLGCYN